MSLLSRFCRTLRQRNQSFSLPVATTENADILSGEKFAAGRSYPNTYASAHRGYGFRDALPEGSPYLGHSSYASGVRAMHWIASSNYPQLGYHRDGTRRSKDCNFNAVLGVRPRFYSGAPILWTLIGANVAVFAMWHKLNYQFMARNFMVSYEHVFLKGRLHTLVTYAFSHFQTDHLLMNLVGLLCFGSTIGRTFGEDILLQLYLGGAIFGSMGHIFYHAYVYPWLKNIPPQLYDIQKSPQTLGASGAVTCLTLLHIYMFPTSTLLFMFVIPMPAALVGCMIIGRDLYLAKTGQGSVSVGAHLGGALLSVLAYFKMKYGL